MFALAIAFIMVMYYLLTEMDFKPETEKDDEE